MTFPRPTFRTVLFSIAAIVVPLGIFDMGYRRGYLDCWETPLVRAIYTVTWRAEDSDTGRLLDARIDWGELFEKGAASAYDIRHADGSITSVLLREKTKEQEITAFIRAPDHDPAPIKALWLNRDPSTQSPNETVLIKLRSKNPEP